MPAKTPLLETSRLILRAHVPDDLKACAEMWADPAVTKYIGGRPSTEQQTWARILAYRGHWELMSFGYWAVVEKVSGLYIGDLGFADFKRQISPSITGVSELGWALTTHAQGKGYATEGLKAALNWHDQCFDAARTVCMIDPDNTLSLRVAEKCGFKEYAETRYMGQASLLFERVVR